MYSWYVSAKTLKLVPETWGNIFPIHLSSPFPISAIFFYIFQGYFCDYEHMLVDIIKTWVHLLVDFQELQEWGYSTWKLSWVSREQSKTVEATDPIDRPVTSDKGQESQKEIWHQQTTGFEPVTSAMQLR